LNKRKPLLAKKLAEVQDFGRLSPLIRQAVVEALLDELGEHGLDANSEPTKYGLEIEALVDFIGLIEKE
jgi:hypothetical protein